VKKVLLDENLPKRLLFRLLENGFEASTVRDMGWLGLKNGKLLSKTLEHQFDIFITSDKKVQFEQNISKIPLAIVILNVKNLNYPQSIQPILLQILEVLPNTNPNQFYVIGGT
jgi:predicted nuclease of predicted toxin-antitoxin system